MVSGGAYLIGGLLVVAAATAAPGESFAAIPTGVFDLPKAADDAFTEGAKAYWDNSAKNLTTTASGNTLIGTVRAPVSAAVEVATDVLAADLLISGLTLQVLDFAQLGRDNATVTVTINGVASVLTEGVDWTAATSHTATATSRSAARTTSIAALSFSSPAFTYTPSTQR